MNEEEKKKYIDELFKVCRSDSILILNKDGSIDRIYCPFAVVVINDVPGLKKWDIEHVTAVKMDLKLIEIYIVKGNAYYYFNFFLWVDDN